MKPSLLWLAAVFSFTPVVAKNIKLLSNVKFNEILVHPIAKRAVGIVTSEKKDKKQMTIEATGLSSYTFDRVSSPAFNSDGTQFAFVGREKNQDFVVLNGKRQEKIADNIWIVGFTPETNKLVYLQEKRGMRSVVVGELQTETLPWMEMPVLSPNGKSLALLLGREVRLIDTDTLKVRMTYEGAFHASFSKYDNELALVIERNKQQFFLWHGKEWGPYDLISHPRFSANAEHAAIWALRGKRQFLVVDQKESRRHAFNYRWCDNNQNCRGPQFPVPTLSDSGRHIAYALPDEGNGIKVYQNGIFVRQVRDLASLAYVPNREELALSFIDAEGKSEVQVGQYRQPQLEVKGTFAFSEKGNHVAYLTQRNTEQQVVVDHQPVFTSSYIAPNSLTFSPTGKQLAFAAAKDSALWWVEVPIKD